MSAIEQTAIIGKIPGYNKNIDSTGEFAQEMLKGVTFIDLLPISYKASLIAGLDRNILDLVEKAASSIFKKPGLFETENEVASAHFGGVLERMETAFGLGKTFSKVNNIRIIAANDSTFTETFTNSFDEENSLVSMAKTFGNQNKILGKIKTMAKAAQGYSHSEMLNLVGGAFGQASSATGKEGAAELMSGIALGMNISAPSMWGASQYTSTLTMFVKLVAPNGTPECIEENILKPLMYLLAASSPLTSYGVMTGFPLLWQVEAHGITNFRLGGIAAMSIIKGSFETTFNTKLQPTVVDVRLTIVPLLNNFAVQTGGDAPSIYTEESKNMLAAQNPSDINRGMMNLNTKHSDEITTIKL